MRLSFFVALAFALSSPALAQHAGHTSQPPATAPPVAPPTIAPGDGQERQSEEPAERAPEHGDHTPADGADPAEQHSGHSEAVSPAQHTGHANAEAVPPPEAGTDVPPDPPTDFAADTFYPESEMERARRIVDREHGGERQSQLMANLLEYRSQDGEDGYAWDGEAWFGGDINRLVVKSEGEGAEDLEEAELQALYSRAVGPYTDLQIGLRHDIEPNPSRTYLALGFETLAPYWFEAEGALFVGEQGQVLGRLEGSYDFMLTQRIVLQPQAELNFAAKDDAAAGIGSGLSSAELGLRLRYDIRREFSPYVGLSYERRFGDTADFARNAGEDPETTSFVIGVRAWY